MHSDSGRLCHIGTDNFLILKIIGKYVESILAYEQALSPNPESLLAYYNLLNSWNGLGKLKTYSLSGPHIV